MLVAYGLVLAGLLASGAARADVPAADDLAAGRKLFAEALDDEDHQRYAAALEKYKQVLQIRETVAIRFRIGATFEALGKINEALDSYKAAVRLGAGSAADAKLVHAAQGRIDALEPKVAHLSIRLSPTVGKDAEVRVDDTPIPTDALNDVRLDPGPHVIVLAGSGGRSTRAEVTLSDGGRAELPLSLEPPPPPATTPAPRPVGRDRSYLRTVGVVTGAAGGILVVGGVVALVLRSNAIAELNKSCPDGNCPASRQNELRSLHDRALLQGPLGGTLLGVGALAVGAGIVLFTLGHDDAQTATRLVPTASSGGLSLTLTKGF